MPAPSDLVHQTTTTTGTGAITLTAVNGKRSFLTAFGTGGTNTFDYYISSQAAAEWERGTGHESAGTLVRDTVIASSNANAAVNFAAGTKDVTNDVPAATQVRGPASSTDNAAARFDGTVNLLQNSALIIDDSGNVSSFGGNIKFPGTQSASADVNTLDDYEEGTFTPAITCDTPGDLTVAYSTQIGHYTKIGRSVTCLFTIITTTFTYTTASGVFHVTGFPFTSGTAINIRGALTWGGLTKALYTDASLSVQGSTTQANVSLSGSGQTSVSTSITDFPTGGPAVLSGAVTYFE